MAQWEVSAMRVLHTQPPSARDLAGIAHTEQALLVHTMAVVNAAIGRSVIDPDDFARRIRPRLQEAQAAWGEVAASWPAPMTTPAPPSLAGVEASAQLHQALDEITRKGNGWATPVQIAERLHLDGAAGLLRDAIAAKGCRAERFAELPAELAGAGHLHAPARLLVAMERHTSGRGHDAESPVRTTDVANRRIVVVRPEQTTGATATAIDLGRQLASLSKALEHSHPADIVLPSSSRYSVQMQQRGGIVRHIRPLRIFSSTEGPLSVDNEGRTSTRYPYVALRLCRLRRGAVRLSSPRPIH
jgi:hypothetical protein